MSIRRAVTNGSSPHTRGLPSAFGEFAAGVRIIPAHAGFTSGGPYRCRRRRDHPRTRGVYDTSQLRVTDTAGSSPHTRGLLLHPPLQG